MCWITPDPERRAAITPGAVPASTRKRSCPSARPTSPSGSTARRRGPAPGRQPVGEDEVEAFGQRVAELAGEDAERFFELEAAFDAHAPSTPHFHLQLVGTLPERQGQGIGSALMAGVLARCSRRHPRLPGGHVRAEPAPVRAARLRRHRVDAPLPVVPPSPRCGASRRDRPRPSRLPLRREPARRLSAPARPGRAGSAPVSPSSPPARARRSSTSGARPDQRAAGGLGQQHLAGSRDVDDAGGDVDVVADEVVAAARLAAPSAGPSAPRAADRSPPPPPRTPPGGRARWTAPSRRPGTTGGARRRAP